MGTGGGGGEATTTATKKATRKSYHDRSEASARRHGVADYLGAVSDLSWTPCTELADWVPPSHTRIRSSLPWLKERWFAEVTSAELGEQPMHT